MIAIQKRTIVTPESKSTTRTVKPLTPEQAEREAKYSAEARLANRPAYLCLHQNERGVYDCTENRKGHGRYCEAHRKESRDNFKKMCEESAREKEEAYTAIESAVTLADSSGDSFAQSAKNTGFKGKVYIQVTPSTSRVARFLSECAGFVKHSEGGVIRFITEHKTPDQNLAYAKAFASSLRNALADAGQPGSIFVKTL